MKTDVIILKKKLKADEVASLRFDGVKKAALFFGESPKDEKNLLRIYFFSLALEDIIKSLMDTEKFDANDFAVLKKHTLQELKSQAPMFEKCQKEEPEEELEEELSDGDIFDSMDLGHNDAINYFKEIYVENDFGSLYYLFAYSQTLYAVCYDFFMGSGYHGGFLNALKSRFTKILKYIFEKNMEEVLKYLEEENDGENQDDEKCDDEK